MTILSGQNDNVNDNRRAGIGQGEFILIPDIVCGRPGDFMIERRAGSYQGLTSLDD